jgi:hypothetical protein
LPTELPGDARNGDASKRSRSLRWSRFQASFFTKSGKLRKYAKPAIVLLHKNVRRPFTRGEILPHELPFSGRKPCHYSGVSVKTDSPISGFHQFMGQSSRSDNSEKARLVDNASVGINDNSVVAEKSINRVRVIFDDRLCEVLFQF